MRIFCKAYYLQVFSKKETHAKKTWVSKLLSDIVQFISGDYVHPVLLQSLDGLIRAVESEYEHRVFPALLDKGVHVFHVYSVGT